MSGVQGVTGSSELVAVGEQAVPPELLQLQQKLRYVYTKYSTLHNIQSTIYSGITLAMYV